MSDKIRGYKVTDKNMQCRGFQYELGKKFIHKGSVSLCNEGFHFCIVPAHCFNYYSFKSENRVFEIEAFGDTKTDGDKTVCSEITFTRELAWDEVLKIVNTGSDNTGHSNSGNWNSGNWNSGNSNSGNSNSGNSNSGNWNSGNSNSGNWNSGYRNSGDSNSGYRNSGAFSTDPNPKAILFNKESSMTIKEWENSRACRLMYNIDPNIWVPMSMMTDDEKASHPHWETTDGYLKTIPLKEAWANFWNNLTEESKSAFTSIENFDPKIFEEITGIKIVAPKKSKKNPK